KARGHKPGTTADVEPATTEVALGAVPLLPPKEAEELSREAAVADAVGSEDQTVLTHGQQQLKDDWFALKDRLLGWSELDLTPERAVVAIPAGQNEHISAELRAGMAWLSRLESVKGIKLTTKVIGPRFDLVAGWTCSKRPTKRTHRPLGSGNIAPQRVLRARRIQDCRKRELGMSDKHRKIRASYVQLSQED